MLRRQPSKIEVKIEDKEELEQARKRAAAAASTTTTTTTDATSAAGSLLHNINRNKDQASKAQRLGISS
uniref:Anaphase-promoting complex subunit CDC26 n=1 Tax=Cucumis sativus TaxID=3659 RepID=A0A0A0LFB1_CUCSA